MPAGCCQAACAPDGQTAATVVLDDEDSANYEPTTITHRRMQTKFLRAAG